MSRRSKPLLPYNFGLFFLTLIIGICSLAYEYTFSKLSSDLLGASHTQWALIIGTMLLAMGVGADFQKRIKNHHLFISFFSLEIILSLVGGFAPLLLYYVFGEGRSYYVIFQFIFTFLTGFIIGMEIPLLLRLNQKYSTQLKFNLAQILRLDYIGGFLGSLLWVYVLVQHWGTILQVGFSLALINLLGLALGLIIFGQNYHYKIKLWLILFFTTLLHSSALFFSPQITPWLEQKFFRDKIIFSQTTPYQNIVLTESQGGFHSLYLNSHLQFNSRDEFIYHEHLVHPAMNLVDHPQSVLILGGGDGLAAREVLKYPQVKHILLIDLDPAITHLAKNHPVMKKINQNSLANSKLIFQKNPGFKFSTKSEGITLFNQNKIHSLPNQADQATATFSFQVLNIDAYLAVQSLVGQYDVIILDFPDPHHLELAKLYSLSFYSFLKNKLNPGGIIVQQSSSPFYAREVFLLIGRTLAKAGFKTIPYQASVPSFGIWGWHLAMVNQNQRSKNIVEKLNQLEIKNPQIKHLTTQLVKNAFFFPKNFFAKQKKTYNSIINNQIYLVYQQNLKNN